MTESKPLAIVFASRDGGASFGWSSKGPEEANPYYIPIFKPGSRDVIEERGGDFVESVHHEVLGFFNGNLSKDIRILPNYPYELYEEGEDKPIRSGKLRPTKDSR